MTLRKTALIVTFSALAFMAGCAGSEIDNPDEGGENEAANVLPEGCLDNDGDGFGGRSAQCPDGPDCDDNDRLINPTAAEVCGDQEDNDCDGTIDEDCERDCVDGDGDGYGDGPECLGPDCDDNDRSIRPGATDVCDNGVDEDCQDGDRVCPADCIDEDRDGFGAEGSTGCETTEVDCDDSNGAVNPTAVEICNGVDDNCDGTIDECPGTGQTCSSGECIGGPGSECLNNDQCAGSLICDSASKLCKQTEGGTCQTAGDCVSGLACEAGECTGNFCALNSCDDPDYPVCYREVGQCVECPIFDPDISVQDAACPDIEQCAPGGWCAINDSISNSLPVDSTTNDVLDMSLMMIECWVSKRQVDVKDVCFSLFVGSDVDGPITEAKVEDAYLDGDLGPSITSEQDDVLRDIWGPGFFNLKEVDWKADPTPGSGKEFCIWYEDGNLFGVEAIVVDRCENFSP